MSTTVSNENRATVTDEGTAVAALRKARLDLATAKINSDDAMADLRDLIVAIRPTGRLDVHQMAAAIERDRNYVDSVWSIYGETEKGRQTRVAPPVQLDGAAYLKALDESYQALAAANKAQRKAAADLKDARAARDWLVAVVYASKILGPTDIAREVGIDRNHVLRLARKAGVDPAHRPDARNQYSA